jgi:hypothetical protein
MKHLLFAAAIVLIASVLIAGVVNPTADFTLPGDVVRTSQNNTYDPGTTQFFSNAWIDNLWFTNSSATNLNITGFLNVLNTNGVLAIGTDHSAGKEAVNSADSIYIGYHAGEFASNSTFQTIVGYYAGRFAESSTELTAYGSLAGNVARRVPGSTFIGTRAGTGANDTSYGTALGWGAGTTSTNYDQAVLIGYYTGRWGANNAQYSVMIGPRAGYSTAYGNSNCVFIGREAGYSVNRPYTLIIDGNPAYSRTTNALVYGEFDNRRFFINGMLIVSNSIMPIGSNATSIGSQQMPFKEISASNFNTVGSSWTHNRNPFLRFTNGQALVYIPFANTDGVAYVQLGQEGGWTNLSQYNNDPGFLTAELDPDWNSNSNRVVYTNDPIYQIAVTNGSVQPGTNFSVARSGRMLNYSYPTNVSFFANDAGYLTGFVETDPIWTSESNLYYKASNPSNFISTLPANLMTNDGPNTVTAGDQDYRGSGVRVLLGTNAFVNGVRLAGSTNFTGLVTTNDPLYKYVESESNKWDTAYGWGDHAAAGYKNNANQTNIVRSFTLEIQDMTNGIAYWMANPFGTRSCTITEIYAKAHGATGAVTVVSQHRSQGWYTYNTVDSGIAANATGTADSSFSGSAAVTNGMRIGFIPSGLSAFASTNLISVDFLISCP